MELYAKCAIVLLGFALAWGYLGQGAGKTFIYLIFLDMLHSFY